jgi:sugar/nucleoside kinase (ribokinase family)
VHRFGTKREQKTADVADSCKKSATSARLVKQPTGLLNKSNVRLASAVAGLAVTRFGTAPAMPTESELHVFLEKNRGE